MITTKDLRGDNLLLIFMDFLSIIVLAWQPSASFILSPAVAVWLVENNLAACSSHASSPRMNDDHKIAPRHSLKQALLLPSLQHDLHFATTTPSSWISVSVKKWDCFYGNCRSETRFAHESQTTDPFNPTHSCSNRLG